MSDLSDESSKLHALTQRNRIDSLQTNLDVCFAFADLVQTEIQMKNAEAAQRALAKAEEGYPSIGRFLPDLEDDESRNEITQRRV